MKNDLYKKLRTRRNLREAWRAVRSSGMSSRREETKDEILEFEKRDDSNLNRLYRLLLKEAYEFKPSRAILIKKKGKKPRPIVVAPVQDRILRRAILQVLQQQPKVRTLIETPWSYGGVVGRGVSHAINEACKSIGGGATYYLRTDIEAFFRCIPRQRALAVLTDGIDDNAFNKILEEATSVELDDVAALDGETKSWYPDDEIGVGQGFCLSPLMGNALLYEFDRTMNKMGVLCLRYIDDFLILGDSNGAVWRAFKAGRKILGELALDCYHPKDKDNPRKAAQGAISQGIDFLGCRITQHQVSPTKTVRQRFIDSIDHRVRTASVAMNAANRTGELDEKQSLTYVLWTLHLSLRAWGSQYSFCNCPQVFKNMDVQIDGLFGKLIRAYDAARRKADTQMARRLLGVHLIQASKSQPILPLPK